MYLISLTILTLRGRVIHQTMSIYYMLWSESPFGKAVSRKVNKTRIIYIKIRRDELGSAIEINGGKCRLELGLLKGRELKLGAEIRN